MSFHRSHHDRQIMKVNGLECVLNTPPALKMRKGSDGQELAQDLPPFEPRPAYAVDAYPASPTNWMHGSAKASSYFVPVKEEQGLWLDFNACVSHSHFVAVLVSVQGINPVTGLPSKGALRLEQYVECCPVHNTPFGQERFCEACGYQWPKQNYLPSNATPQGLLWIDGFRGADGIVRQFLFTAKEARGVAAQIIGEQRVFAIGIAFYLSKQPKPQPALPRARGGVKAWGEAASAAMHHVEVTPEVAAQHGKQFLDPTGLGVPPSLIQLVPESVARECLILPLSQEGETLSIVMGDPDDAETVKRLSFILNRTVQVMALAPRAALHKAICRHYGDAESESVDSMLQEFTDTAINSVEAVDDVTVAPATAAGESVSAPSALAAEEAPEAVPMQGDRQPQPKRTKHLEIAGGARIDQRIHDDPETLDFWQDEPAGMIYVNYVPEEEVEQIIAAGERDLTAGGEGFMQHLAVGNP